MGVIHHYILAVSCFLSRRFQTEFSLQKPAQYVNLFTHPDFLHQARAATNGPGFPLPLFPRRTISRNLMLASEGSNGYAHAYADGKA